MGAIVKVITPSALHVLDECEISMLFAPPKQQNGNDSVFFTRARDEQALMAVELLSAAFQSFPRSFRMCFLRKILGQLEVQALDSTLQMAIKVDFDPMQGTPVTPGSGQLTIPILDSLELYRISLVAGMLPLYQGVEERLFELSGMRDGERKTCRRDYWMIVSDEDADGEGKVTP